MKCVQESMSSVFDLNGHTLLIWRPNVGHDISYELKSLTHELETWKLFITISLHLKDCEYKEERS